MSWIASDRKELTTLLTVTILSTLMILPSYVQCIPSNPEQTMTTNDLGVPHIQQRKDTRMLCLEGCSLIGPHAWDIEHETRGCEHDNWYCIPASIKMITLYYGGNLSMDRIVNYILREYYHQDPENDLGHGGGISGGMVTIALSWALMNNIEIFHEAGEKPPLEEIKQWIDQGRPIVIQYAFHYKVIDGYTDEYLHVIDPWYGEETKIHYNDLNVYNRWIPPADATARNDEPELWTDSDNDGIVDFDETNRFFADPYNNDTDNDGILDKIEIQSYTFIGDVFDEEDIRLPDSDEDGLRAELDWDSDDGGCPDGLEDLNHNGVLDNGETDPFDPSDDPLVEYPVALFTHQPQTAWINETVSFNATQSYSPNGNITAYEWDFGDGNITTVEYPVINHTYAEPGNYNVTLKVTDDKSLWNLTSQTIKICHITDLNKDGTVNIQDLFTVAKAFGSHGPDVPNMGDPASEKWNPIADVNKDGWISIKDLLKVAKDFGKTV